MLWHFSDFLVLSACAINEGQSLIQWLGQMDFKAICVAGIRKGGYLATVAGMGSPNSVRIVSVVAPHSGVAVFLEGLLGRLCDWDLLQKSSGEEKPVRQHMAEAFALDQYRLAKILAVVVPMCFLSQSINHLGRNRVIGFK